MSDRYIIEFMNEQSQLFDELVYARRSGSDLNDQFAFLEEDLQEQICSNMIDLAIYAREQFVKMRMLQYSLGAQFKDVSEDGVITIGKTAFKRSGS